MESIILNSSVEQEIPMMSGKTIRFKKITIPAGMDCSQFRIDYRIINNTGTYRKESWIDCAISPYQKLRNFKLLEARPIEVPADAQFYLKIGSIDPSNNFSGNATIIYDVSYRSRVFISKADKENAYRIALRNLARFFDVQGWELMGNEELRFRINDSVDAQRSNIVNLLNDYLHAYDNWFSFYENIRRIEQEKDMEYEFTNEDHSRLAVLIQNRQDALNALQRRFDQLQFERFKRQQGLENADGIIYE